MILATNGYIKIILIEGLICQDLDMCSIKIYICHYHYKVIISKMPLFVALSLFCLFHHLYIRLQLIFNPVDVQEMTTPEEHKRLREKERYAKMSSTTK